MTWTMLAAGWTIIIAEMFGAAILLLTAFFLYCKYVVYEFWSKRAVRYVEPTVPIGNVGPLIMGRKSLGELFEEAYARYKGHRLFGMYTILKPNLVVADPDLIRLVLAKEFASFHDRGIYCNEKIDPLTGHLFLLPGKKWRNLRVKLTPTFTSGKIKLMFDALKECGEQLRDYLEPLAKERATVEMKDVFARFSTDVIMSVAFGIHCNSLKNPDCEFRHWGRKVFEPRPFWNSIVIFAPKLMDALRIPFTDAAVERFFTSVFRETIEQRKARNIVRRDFLDLIMQLMERGYVDVDADGEAEAKTDGEADGEMRGPDGRANTGRAENKLSMLEGAAQAYVFYLAGFETSSTTATHCLYELALNPTIQERTRTEIDSALEKHGGLTFNSLADMPYLHNVISETMRKYPALPVLNRVCTKDIELEGVRIPAGTLVTIPVLGLHKDPSIYPNPERFEPERFSPENVTARHPYAYLPFGEGPRICIGLRFGLVQTKVAVISALSRFRFKVSPTTPIPLVFDAGSIVLSSKAGVPLIVEQR